MLFRSIVKVSAWRSFAISLSNEVVSSVNCFAVVILFFLWFRGSVLSCWHNSKLNSYEIPFLLPNFYNFFVINSCNFHGHRGRSKPRLGQVNINTYKTGFPALGSTTCLGQF